jgi:hypothetical protein
MKNTFFKPDSSFALNPLAITLLGKGLYNKATLRTLKVTEGKKNNTYNPTILNKNTLKKTTNKK